MQKPLVMQQQSVMQSVSMQSVEQQLKSDRLSDRYHDYQQCKQCKCACNSHQRNELNNLCKCNQLWNQLQCNQMIDHRKLGACELSVQLCFYNPAIQSLYCFYNPASNRQKRNELGNQHKMHPPMQSMPLQTDVQSVQLKSAVQAMETSILLYKTYKGNQLGCASKCNRHAIRLANSQTAIRFATYSETPL